MKTNHIEVELRGPLPEPAYQKIMQTLTSLGGVVKKQNRFLLDYSTFIEGIGERKLDVRVRKTNGKPEIIVKKGKFGGTSREEVLRWKPPCPAWKARPVPAWRRDRHRPCFARR